MLKAKKPRVERQQGFLNSQELVSSLRCVRTFCSFYFGKRGELFFLTVRCLYTGAQWNTEPTLPGSSRGRRDKAGKKAEAERRPDQFQHHRMRWCFSFKQQNRAIKDKTDGGKGKIMLTLTGVQAVWSSTNEWTKLGDRQSVFLSLLIFLPFTVSMICCLGGIADTQTILIMIERDAAVKHWCTFAL